VFALFLIPLGPGSVRAGKIGFEDEDIHF